MDNKLTFAATSDGGHKYFTYAFESKYEHIHTIENAL